jgi:lipopolysaccharide/colanic/teichoic acid biosynthesis glycosyltransferase
MKRLLDVVLSAIGLLIASPLLLVVMFLIWRQDGASPFYIAPRVGKGERPFDMVKLRSMIVNADKSGVDSTAKDDMRITPVGQFVRRYKLDELAQLWNVLKGDMSLVGPRPNVKRETDLYTSEEKKLLTLAPGVTDFASIVFSDEADILAGQADPDLAYNQLIRPRKSRLGLFYVAHSGVALDLQLILLTAVAVVSKSAALRGVVNVLERLGAPADLVDIARRDRPLVPAPPPGGSQIVTSRHAG